MCRLQVCKLTSSVLKNDVLMYQFFLSEIKFLYNNQSFPRVGKRPRFLKSFFSQNDFPKI